MKHHSHHRSRHYSNRNERGVMTRILVPGVVLLFVFARNLESVESFTVSCLPVGVSAARRRPYGTALSAFDLNSAFEWLSEKRYNRPGYQNIAWIELDETSESNLDDANDPKDETETVVTMPLYPLGATYLPGSANHTLNNIEPQNLKMAQDLLLRASPSGTPPRFCVTLRALDSGSVANVGTVLRILEAEEQFQGNDDNKRLVRIRLTCRAEELVEICEIVNPQAFASENRIRKSSEYLTARIRPLSMVDTAADMVGLQQEIKALINNFNMIKTIYQLEIGSEGFPPSHLFQLGNAMTDWDDTNFSSEQAFWESAQEWQSVCYTIRQGKQAMLSMNRNERMVAEASKLSGPLKLPIHLEDLPPPVQREIQLMEVEAQTDYSEQIRMDPCLDFQALMSLSSHRERVLCLADMISREKQRLEAVATERSRRARA